jgi:hypothetical protein
MLIHHLYAQIFPSACCSQTPSLIYITHSGGGITFTPLQNLLHLEPV